VFIFPNRLPPTDALPCDRCAKVRLLVRAKWFDLAWKEIHAQGWTLVGTGSRRWELLCPHCRPHPSASCAGLTTGDMMKARGD
jgi:hypothetical protein